MKKNFMMIAMSVALLGTMSCTKDLYDENAVAEREAAKAVVNEEKLLEAYKADFAPNNVSFQTGSRAATRGASTAAGTRGWLEDFISWLIGPGYLTPTNPQPTPSVNAITELDEWYEVPSATRALMNTVFGEGNNNTQKLMEGTFFEMIVPENDFYILPIYMGQSGGSFKLFLHVEGVEKDILVWNKNNCIPLGLPSNAGMVSHICELIFCFNQTGSRAFSHPQWKKGVWNGQQMINRIDSKNQMNNEYSKVHHATFPVEFAGQVIEMYSEKSVLDQFGGTGTSMIAAEQLGRKCFMMELDPHYCDIIIARWEKFTGQKAYKEL